MQDLSVPLPNCPSPSLPDNLVFSPLMIYNMREHPTAPPFSRRSMVKRVKLPVRRSISSSLFVFAVFRVTPFTRFHQTRKREFPSTFHEGVLSVKIWSPIEFPERGFPLLLFESPAFFCFFSAPSPTQALVTRKKTNTTIRSLHHPHTNHPRCKHSTPKQIKHINNTCKQNKKNPPPTPQNASSRDQLVFHLLVA